MMFEEYLYPRQMDRRVEPRKTEMACAGRAIYQMGSLRCKLRLKWKIKPSANACCYRLIGVPVKTTLRCQSEITAMQDPRTNDGFLGFRDPRRITRWIVSLANEDSGLNRITFQRLDTLFIRRHVKYNALTNSIFFDFLSLCG